MKMTRPASFLILASIGCVGVVPFQKYPRPSDQVRQDVANFYDHEPQVTRMLKQSKEEIGTKDPVDWWKQTAIAVLESQKLVPTGGVIAACLHTPQGDSSYIVKGRMKPENLFENDIAFYDVLMLSNKAIADRYAEMRALTRAADEQFGYKDDFRMMALRGLVSYERLLDHHRFILREIQRYDCLSSQAATDVKWEDEELKTYQAMVTNVKKSGQQLQELQGVVDQAFELLSKPLADKKAYASLLDAYTFMHRVFGENTEDVDKDCRALAKGALNYAFKIFACGYVAEKDGHDSKAKKFYAVAKSANIEYAGPAAKRSQVLDDWNSPLQTDEARKTEGDSQYQTHIDFK